MTGKHDKKSARLRQEVAFEAARILATEGQRNYLAAKQKAAQRIGVPPRGALPSNREVEEALKSWQTLYGGSEHDNILRHLRLTAVEAMGFFSDFNPRLVGPVLEGTADAYSRIALHLFSEDPDAVPRYLINKNIPFEQETRRIRWHDGEYRNLDIVVFEAGEHSLEAALLSAIDARQAPPSPIDGRPQRRAGIGEVRSLLESGQPGYPGRDGF